MPQIGTVKPPGLHLWSGATCQVNYRRMSIVRNGNQITMFEIHQGKIVSLIKGAYLSWSSWYWNSNTMQQVRHWGRWNTFSSEPFSREFAVIRPITMPFHRPNYPLSLLEPDLPSCQWHELQYSGHAWDRRVEARLLDPTPFTHATLITTVITR